MTEQDGWNLELLQERLAELEMALFNDGWARLGQTIEHEFSRDALGQIAYLARLMYLKNPLIRRGVDVQAFYVFGQGVTITHENEQVNAVVQRFLDDASNRLVLTSNQAMLAQERQLQLDGNLFLVFFTNPATGRVRARTIPFDEMQEIITDPEDAATPWFYRRSWAQQRVDLATGTPTTETRTTYYPDWRYAPAAKPASIGGQPVRWDAPVMHVRTGGLTDMQFGISEVYPQIDWARAYKEFLEDWATLTRAYSRFAHKLSVPGGARGVAAAKTKLHTTYGNAGTGAETNPPPVVGSTFVAGEGVDLTPMRIGGANVSAEDGRRLLLMVAAGAGLPETFYGDASVGTVATAKSLDRPTELKMLARQALWSDVLRDVLRCVLTAAVRAGDLVGEVIAEPDGTPRLELDGDLDAMPSVEFPPILEHDVQEMIGAVVSAATLDGKTPAGTLDSETTVRLLCQALGVQDVQQVLDALAREEAEPEPAEPPDETPEPQPEQDATEPDEAEPPARNSEALMIKAVQELRQALRPLVEAGHE